MERCSLTYRHPAELRAPSAITGHSHEAQPANLEKPLRPAVPKNGDTAIAVFDAQDIAQEEKPYRNTDASFDADERRETG